LWEWRNEPGVRSNSFDQRPIAWEDHERWFQARLANAGSVIWILQVDGVAVGQVRYERIDVGAEAHVSVAPEARGRGLGVQLLRLTTDSACTLFSADVLVAHVLPGNEASRHAFVNAGYRQVASVLHGANEVWRLEYRCAGRAETPPTDGRAA
jgi:RimJ/RimL family protein N-acetyltransferase